MSDVNQQVIKYLTDAHGMEEQSLRSLEASAKSASVPQLKTLFESHITETRSQQQRIAERLTALGASPSKAKDTGNALISFGKGLIDTVRPDNAGKNLRDAYVGESLEIVSYELLKRTAQRAGDTQTQQLADTILAEERATLQQLEGLLDPAVDASLAEETSAA